jgi:hypothetical protein
MDLKFKIALSFVACSLLLLMGYCIKIQNDTIKQLQSITESQQNQQKYLEDNITRIRSTLVSKDEFSNKLKELDLNLSSINKDLSSIGAKANEIIVIQNKTLGTIKEGLASSGKTPLPPVDGLSCKEDGCYKDKYGYFKFQQQLSLSDNNMPVGTVSFNATSPTPWSYTIFPRTYNTSIVLATDSLGKKTAYAKVSIESEGKTYTLPQTQVKYYEQLPSNEFSWFNPRILMGLSAGISMDSDIKYSMIPGLQLYIASYGQLKYNPKLNILGVGAGFDIISKTTTLMITPFTYRLFDSNLVQNLHLGPSVGFDIHERTFLGLQISLGL